MDAKIFCFGPFRLDINRYELTEYGAPCVLPRLAMELLLLLVRSGGRLVTRGEIARAMWPATSDPEDVTPSINTAINRIRQVLRDDPVRPAYVQTVIGKGYRFMAPVRSGEDAGRAEVADAGPAEVARERVGGTGEEVRLAAALGEAGGGLAAQPVPPPISLEKLHAWYLAGAPVEVSALRVDDRTSVMAVRGPLRLGPGLKMLELQLTTEMDRGARALVLDLRAVPMMDSAGLGLLLHLFGQMAERGGVLRMCGVTERVRELLRMTRTEGLLLIDADVGASLAALG